MGCRRRWSQLLVPAQRCRRCPRSRRPPCRSRLPCAWRWTSPAFLGRRCAGQLKRHWPKQAPAQGWRGLRGGRPVPCRSATRRAAAWPHGWPARRWSASCAVPGCVPAARPPALGCCIAQRPVRHVPVYLSSPRYARQQPACRHRLSMHCLRHRRTSLRLAHPGSPVNAQVCLVFTFMPAAGRSGPHMGAPAGRMRPAQLAGPPAGQAADLGAPEAGRRVCRAGHAGAPARGRRASDSLVCKVRRCCMGLQHTRTPHDAAHLTLQASLCSFLRPSELPLYGQGMQVAVTGGRTARQTLTWQEAQCSSQHGSHACLLVRQGGAGSGAPGRRCCRGRAGMHAAPAEQRLQPAQHRRCCGGTPSCAWLLSWQNEAMQGCTAL